MKDNLVEIQIKGTLHICVDLKYSLGWVFYIKHYYL